MPMSPMKPVYSYAVPPPPPPASWNGVVPTTMTTSQETETRDVEGQSEEVSGQQDTEAENVREEQSPPQQQEEMTSSEQTGL